MKRLLIIFSIILPIISFAQPQMPIKEGKVFYEVVDTIPDLTKVELYNRSKIWFVNTFNNAKAVLQLDDKETGVIMGKGVTSYDASNALIGPMHNYINYTININIKENKVRMQVYDISVSNENASYTPEYCLKYPKMNKKKLEKIDGNIKDLIESYKASISKQSNDSF